MTFLISKPPRGSDPELVRRLSKTQERIAPLTRDPLPDDMPQHIKEAFMRADANLAKMGGILGEIQANRLEMQEIIDEGYEKGVFPVDEELAANADEYQRELEAFDRNVATDEAQWAKEDAAEPPRRK